MGTVVENVDKNWETWESESEELKPERDTKLVEGKISTISSALTTSHEEKIEKDLYTRLITEGPYIPGDTGELLSLDEIPWFDKTLWDHSLEFHKKFITLLVLCNTTALMFGFAIKPNTAVLLRTGMLHDPELSFKRYLSTGNRIGKFFELYLQKPEAYKSFDTVRKMHALASKKRKEHHPTAEDLCLSAPWKKELVEAMRKDLEFIDTSSAPEHILTWDPPVPVSQFDMAVTQMGFFGTMWLYPKFFGIENREDEMKGIMHMWAVFGKLLGIKDEFNICIKPDANTIDKLFTNIVLASFKTMDESVITIQSVYMDALQSRVPWMRYKTMLYYGLREVEGYKGDNLWKLMTWKDKLALQVTLVWILSIKHCLPFRVFMNIFTVIWLRYQSWAHLSKPFFE